MHLRDREGNKNEKSCVLIGDCAEKDFHQKSSRQHHWNKMLE
jgi:hypothetical protein